MKAPILTVWVAGALFGCLGGCPVSTNPPGEELLPVVTESDGTTRDTPAVEVPDESEPTTPANQLGPSEPIPPLYDWPATPSDSDGTS